MQLIDNEGKIFGKINLVDLISLIVLIAIFLAIINFINAEEEKLTKIKVQIKVQNKPSWFADQIKIGDKMIFGSVPRATVKNISVSDSITSVYDHTLKKIIPVTNFSSKDIDITLDLWVDKHKNRYFYYMDSSQIVIEKPFTIILPNIELEGTIISIEEYDE